MKNTFFPARPARPDIAPGATATIAVLQHPPRRQNPASKASYKHPYSTGHASSAA